MTKVPAITYVLPTIFSDVYDLKIIDIYMNLIQNLQC